LSCASPPGNDQPSEAKLIRVAPCIVIVSDVELRRAKYSHLKASLLHLLLHERSLSVNIFDFSGIYRPKSPSIWHSFMEAGDDLIDALSASLDYSVGPSVEHSQFAIAIPHFDWPCSCVVRYPPIGLRGVRVWWHRQEGSLVP